MENCSNCRVIGVLRVPIFPVRSKGAFAQKGLAYFIVFNPVFEFIRVAAAKSHIWHSYNYEKNQKANCYEHHKAEIQVKSKTDVLYLVCWPTKTPLFNVFTSYFVTTFTPFNLIKVNLIINLICFSVIMSLFPIRRRHIRFKFKNLQFYFVRFFSWIFIDVSISKIYLDFLFIDLQRHLY